MFRASPGVLHVVGRRRWRFRFADFLVRMWLLNAFRRRTLPGRSRRTASWRLCGSSSSACWYPSASATPAHLRHALAGGSESVWLLGPILLSVDVTRYVASRGSFYRGVRIMIIDLPSSFAVALDLRHIGQRRRDPVHHFPPELRVRDLPPAEHHRHLHLVAVLQETRARVASSSRSRGLQCQAGTSLPSGGSRAASSWPAGPSSPART